MWPASMRPGSSPTRTHVSPFQGLALRRRIADAVKVKVGSRKLAVALVLVSLAGIVLLVARSGTKVFQAAATPDWRYLLAGPRDLRRRAAAARARLDVDRALARRLPRDVRGQLGRLVPRHRPAGTHGRGLEGRRAEGGGRPALARVLARGREPALRAPARDGRLRARRRRLRVLPAGSHLGEDHDARRPAARLGRPRARLAAAPPGRPPSARGRRLVPRGRRRSEARDAARRA